MLLRSGKRKHGQFAPHAENERLLTDLFPYEVWLRVIDFLDDHETGWFAKTCRQAHEMVSVLKRPLSCTFRSAGRSRIRFEKAMAQEEFTLLHNGAIKGAIEAGVKDIIKDIVKKRWRVSYHATRLISHEIIKFAVSVGKLDFLKEYERNTHYFEIARFLPSRDVWRLGEVGAIQTEWLLAAAVQYQRFDILQWCKEHDHVVTRDLLIDIDKVHYVAVLLWAHKVQEHLPDDFCVRDHPTDPLQTASFLREQNLNIFCRDTWQAFVRRKHLDGLKWLKANNCEMHPDSVALAINDQSMDILRWFPEEAFTYCEPKRILEMGYISDLDMAAAADSMYVKLFGAMNLEMLVAAGLRCNTKTANAMYFFSKYPEAPWDAQHCASALKRPDGLPFLKLLRSRSVPWDGRTCIAACEYNNLEGLQWAIDNGCPFEVKKCMMAAVSGAHIAIVRYLRQHYDVQWSFDFFLHTIRFFGGYYHFCMIRHLIRDGCPWSKKALLKILDEHLFSRYFIEWVQRQENEHNLEHLEKCDSCGCWVDNVETIMHYDRDDGPQPVEMCRACIAM